MKVFGPPLPYKGRLLLTANLERFKLTNITNNTDDLNKLTQTNAVRLRSCADVLVSVEDRLD